MLFVTFASFLVPDITNLNISLENIDLQSVLIKWDPLPKYYWNGPEPGYVVQFEDISHGSNFTVEIPPGTTEMNYTQLDHFTSYSVSIMALNYIGTSLPTDGGVIKTLDHGKLVINSWVSRDVINFSGGQL